MPKENNNFDRYNRSFSLGWSCCNVLTDAFSVVAGAVIAKDVSAEHDTFSFCIGVLLMVGGVAKGCVDLGNTAVKAYDVFWRNRTSSSEASEQIRLVETSEQNDSKEMKNTGK